jgi:two-component system, probable response regulator PhcQ
MRNFLIVDDETSVLHALQRTLRQAAFDEEWHVEIFADPHQALARGNKIAFDVVISDYRMPSMNGVDFLNAFKAIQPDAVRMVLSASTEFDTLINAINQAEVFRFIAKPWQTADLLEAIELALVRRDQSMENLRLFNELRAQFGEMSPQELEAKRLEQEEPGITRVKWGDDGSVHLD